MIDHGGNPYAKPEPEPGAAPIDWHARYTSERWARSYWEHSANEQCRRAGRWRARAMFALLAWFLTAIISAWALNQ